MTIETTTTCEEFFQRGREIARKCVQQKLGVWICYHFPGKSTWGRVSLPFNNWSELPPRCVIFLKDGKWAAVAESGKNLGYVTPDQAVDFLKTGNPPRFSP